MSTKNVFIFCLARELLEGSVLDRNGNFMAKSIDRLAFRVQSIQVLDEVEDEMVAGFRAALAQSPSYTITTGGMGPGHDDLTRNCVARAADLPLLDNERAADWRGKRYTTVLSRGAGDTARPTDATAQARSAEATIEARRAAVNPVAAAGPTAPPLPTPLATVASTVVKSD